MLAQKKKVTARPVEEAAVSRAATVAGAFGSEVLGTPCPLPQPPWLATQRLRQHVHLQLGPLAQQRRLVRGLLRLVSEPAPVASVPANFERVVPSVVNPARHSAAAATAVLAPAAENLLLVSAVAAAVAAVAVAVAIVGTPAASIVAEVAVAALVVAVSGIAAFGVPAIAVPASAVARLDPVQQELHQAHQKLQHYWSDHRIDSVTLL